MPDAVAWAGALLGGLAVFLLGLDQLTEGLKKAAGDSLRAMMGRLTRNPFLGLMSGVVVTAILQSSSVTTVLLVGFVAAGMIRFRDSLAVILGANIGSTVTAQIIAFDVQAHALPLLAIGFAVAQTLRQGRVAAWGQGAMGLGLIFLGMSIMSETMRPLGTDPAAMEVLAAVSKPWVAVLAGLVVTAILQSSAATAAMVIVLAGQGLVTLEIAIALVLGANIGTCATAMLASIGKSRPAVRTAIGHVLFNAIGAVVWLPFIPELAELARAVSALMGEDITPAREIANAHSLFNIANTVAAFPLIGLGARLIQFLLPDRGPDTGASDFLRPELLGTPELALAAAREDILATAERLRARFEGALDLALHGGRVRLEEAVDATAREVPGLLALFDYLRRLAAGNMTERQAGDQVRLLRATNALAGLRETLQTAILRAGLARIEADIVPSAASDAALDQVHRQVLDALDLAISAFRNEDAELAQRVQARKKTVRPLFAGAQDHLLTRLMSTDPNRARTFTLETELLHGLKTAFGHVRAFARAVPYAPEPAPRAAASASPQES